MSEQPYNLEDAREEARQMREKIESGEAKDYSEAGKLTGKEKIPTEKDKTPEEIEAEKEAMEKLLDIEEIFYRDKIFGLKRYIEIQAIETYSFHYKTKGEVKRDLLNSNNFFHHVAGNNLAVLRNPLFNSVSCYSFWRTRALGGYYRGGEEDYCIGNEEKAANDVDICVVLSKSSTEKCKQEALGGKRWGDDNAEDWSKDPNSDPYDLQYAEAYFQDKGDPKAISGIIIGPKGLAEIYDTKTGEVLNEKKLAEYRESLKPYDEKLQQIRQKLLKLVGTEYSQVEKEQKAIILRLAEERGKLYRVRPASEKATLIVAKKLGTVSNVPVFDSDGNMLWPKQMGKNEVVEYIKSKK